MRRRRRASGASPRSVAMLSTRPRTNADWSDLGGQPARARSAVCRPARASCRSTRWPRRCRRALRSPAATAAASFGPSSSRGGVARGDDGMHDRDRRRVECYTMLPRMRAVSASRRGGARRIVLARLRVGHRIVAATSPDGAASHSPELFWFAGSSRCFEKITQQAFSTAGDAGEWLGTSACRAPCELYRRGKRRSRRCDGPSPPQRRGAEATSTRRLGGAA